VTIFTEGRFEKVVDRVIVKLCNDREPRATTINYIIFKGTKLDETKKELNIMNFSKEDVFPKCEKQKVAENQKGSEIKKITSPADLALHASNFESSLKTRKQERIEQLMKEDKLQFERAMQESRKQEELRKKEYQIRMGFRNPDPVPIVIDDDDPSSYFDYEVVDYDKIKKIYEHVTPQWVEAQRRAEREHNIIARHSLADRIKIKVFTNTSFFLGAKLANH
jgi:hypothetical protein